jgi:hypothetical protein
VDRGHATAPGSGRRTLAGAPAECTVALGGEEKGHPLAWSWDHRGALEERVDRARQAVDRSEPPAISGFGPGAHWVRVPTFAPGGANVDRMRELIATLPTLRDERLVVFDVRGNTGGASAWGTQIVSAFFGPAAVRWVQCDGPPSEKYTEWRVSPGNLAYIEQLTVSTRQRFGEDSPSYHTFSRLRDEMRAALDRGHELAREPQAPEATADCPGHAPRLPEARVILLTDEQCASACLDFADALLPMPGVVHAGRQTSADAVYMDIRAVAIPSGLGHFVFGQKVDRNRPRGHNEPYDPHHRYPGDISDTPAVAVWLLELARRIPAM